MFGKLLRRKPALTLLLLLLLALAAGFSAVGYAAWDSAQAQLAMVDSQYTTIAVPRTEDGNTIYAPDGTTLISCADLLEAAKQAPGYLGEDRRGLLSAQVSEMQGLSSGTLNTLDYNSAFDHYTYSFSVFALECLSVDPREGSTDYIAAFRILDAVCRKEAYDLPPEEDVLYLGLPLYDQAGNIPFQVGKTYLMRGFYQDYSVVQTLGGDLQRVTDGSPSGGIRMLTFTSDAARLDLSIGVSEDGEPVVLGEGVPYLQTQVGTRDGQMFRYVTGQEELPFFTEYTGSWQDFLQTPEGEVWRDRIIPMCQLNQNSAAVVLTSQLESLHWFNTGNASILSGRSMTRQEYETGAPVCVISAGYAQLNGLAVGDTLTLDLYNTGYGIVNVANRSPVSAQDFYTLTRRPLTDRNRLGITQDYQIIGIYTAPAFSPGAYAFCADTIFIPKASIPDAGLYEDPYTLQLNSILLENGMAEEFEAYMAEQGCGGSLLYFDQAYTQAQGAVEAMASGALRLWLVGAAAFILTAALFLFLSFRRVAPTVRGMRLLGIPGKGVAVQLFAALALVIAGAVALGGGLAAALFGWVTRQTLSGQLALRPQAVLLAALVQLAVLLPVTGLWAWGKARQNLMKKP